MNYLNLFDEGIWIELLSYVDISLFDILKQEFKIIEQVLNGKYFWNYNLSKYPYHTNYDSYTLKKLELNKCQRCSVNAFIYDEDMMERGKEESMIGYKIFNIPTFDILKALDTDVSKNILEEFYVKYIVEYDFELKEGPIVGIYVTGTEKYFIILGTYLETQISKESAYKFLYMLYYFSCNAYIMYSKNYTGKKANIHVKPIVLTHRGPF